MIKLIDYANQNALIIIIQLMGNIYVLINVTNTIMDHFVLTNVL